MKTGIHLPQKWQHVNRNQRQNPLSDQNENNNQSDDHLWWVCSYCGRCCNKFEKLKLHILQIHYENEEDRKRAIPKPCFIMPMAQAANASADTEELKQKQTGKRIKKKTQHYNTNDGGSTKTKMDEEDADIKMKMPSLLPETRPRRRSRVQPKSPVSNPVQQSKSLRISNRKVKPKLQSSSPPSSPIKSKSRIRSKNNETTGALPLCATINKNSKSTTTTTATRPSTKSKSKPGKRLNGNPLQRVTLILKGKSPIKKDPKSSLAISSPSNQQDDTLKESFDCPTCLKSFARVSYLQLHMKLHTGIRRYPCRHECGKSFNSPSNRIAHERLHLGIRPFVCTVCKASFANASNFKKHKQLHSKGFPGRQNVKKGKKNRKQNKVD